MTVCLQKANFWKRISAYLFDLILSVMLTVAIASGVSAVLRYDSYTERLQTYYTRYETEYDTNFDISEEEYDQLTEEEKANYQQATDAFSKDVEVRALYAKMFYLTLVIVSMSLLLTHLLLYFLVPLLFKNGQTLGKKIFGLAVVRTNCVRISNPVLFVRAIIGQYTIETMVPVLLFVMIYFGVMGSVGTLTILLLFGLQIVVLAVSRTNSAIHDLLSDTVVADMASQDIFESQEALLRYKEEQQAREAAQASYAEYPNNSYAPLNATTNVPDEETPVEPDTAVTAPTNADETTANDNTAFFKDSTTDR